jgi:hypothetical protein
MTTFAETLKQAMDDWNAATPEQRQAALDYAANLASSMMPIQETK